MVTLAWLVTLVVFGDDWWNVAVPLFCRRIMILLDIEVLRKGSEVKEKLGNPNQLKPDGAAAGRLAFCCFCCSLSSPLLQGNMQA